MSMKRNKKKYFTNGHYLTINQYKDWCTTIWTNKTRKLSLRDDYVMGMGLSGEVGEVQELLKKAVRDQHDITKVDKKKLTKELGDVLYYLMMMCHRHGLEPQDVINENIRKLEQRYKNR